MAKRKNTDEGQPNESSDNINESDDAFGLPEIEYEPLARDKSTESSSQDTEQHQPVAYEPEEQTTSNEEPSQQSHYTHMQEQEKRGSSGAGIIIFIVIILASVVAGYFLYWKPKQDKIAKEAAARKAAKEKADNLEQLRRDSIAFALEREQRLQDSIANAQTKVGQIEMLTERTGKYHVVIASAIDDDLLMDYAKKLSRKGVSSKIVAPFGDIKFYRLTIADGDTYSSTQAVADGLKGEYGSEVWVLKY